MNKKKITIGLIAIVITCAIIIAGIFVYNKFIKNGGIPDDDLVTIPIEEVVTEVLDPELMPKDTTVNDTFFAEQKHQLSMMGVPYAWDKVKAEGEVTVAVLDSGCRYTQPDLAENLRLDLAYDAYHECALQDSPVENGANNGHGTWVCSTISAIANNNYGLAGASYNAKIIPIKISDDSKQAYGRSSTMVTAYKYLMGNIDNGKIDNLVAINISYGGAVFNQELQNAINTMYKKYGVITVASAGNDGKYGDTANRASYPSDMDNVLSVQAVDDNNRYTHFSSWNENKDVAAPGSLVPVMVSDKDKNEITYVSGTSFAAPYTTAVVSLIKRYKPELTPDDVVKLLKDTAKPVNNASIDHNGKDGCVGIVQLDAVIKRLIAQEDNFKDAEVKTVKSKYAYTGTCIKPEVKVYIGDKLIDKKYYTVTYKNNVNIGKATAIVKAKGKYKGTVSCTFKIIPKKVTGLKVTNVGKYTYKISWNKSPYVTKYSIYVEDKNGDGSSWTTKSTSDIDTYSKGKNIVKVRCYYSVNKVKYYSDWATTEFTSKK